ncbi:MAG: hypothetical protein Q9187_007199 [Circinaria calcarea]
MADHVKKATSRAFSSTDPSEPPSYPSSQVFGQQSAQHISHWQQSSQTATGPRQHFRMDDLTIGDMSSHSHSSISGASPVSNDERSTSPSVGDDEKDFDPQRCTFSEGCMLESEDRKVVSHYFGRNKLCTLGVPDHIWAPYCRKHYQRTRYRNVGNYVDIQMDLVKTTLKRMKKWGGVADFEFTLRLQAQKHVDREIKHEKTCEEARAAGKAPPPAVDATASEERWLVPHLGKNKSFDEIFSTVEKIIERVENNLCQPPQFEILPSFKPGWAKPRKPSKRALALAAAGKPAGVQKSRAKGHRRTSQHRPTPASPTTLDSRQSGQLSPSSESSSPSTDGGRQSD